MIDAVQLQKFGLFDARVPRYTSYPPAPHFQPAVAPEATPRWLAQLPPGSPLSIYVHIPFCRRLCWFCACRTQGVRSADPVRAYVETLLQEIRLIRQHLPEMPVLSRVHLGGGTPTLLTVEMLQRLIAALLDLAPMATDFELSVEIDPSEIDDARLDCLAEMGMNRASVGVQDFDPHVQDIIGRRQSFDLTKDVVDALRARGVFSINVDMLYGLPDQNQARLTETTQKVLSLNPDRLALYGYAHVPWMSRRQRLIPAETLPDGEARLMLFHTAARLSAWDGFHEIGIDHFARPDDGLARAHAQRTMRRNFQGYTDDPATALLGLGASAISRFPQGYAQNAPKTADYLARIRAGQLAVNRGHVFTKDDKLRSAMIEELLCYFTVTPRDISKTAQAPMHKVRALTAQMKEAFPTLLDDWDDQLVLTPTGRVLARVIAASLDAYTGEKNRHSAAI
ncbi:oxygen-independent coproporphyrinogen III oxidase [Actibacterium sp. 188UL27-1]|uniref:oxygen-independent coproporphyrinogen III oxidase n=1 Tax=Actibacterium sp. 188UL27-1 TaxID=2786961 RepID=UPI00195737A8|nr:oxygen-independent coproporphyrinogen III oxidase [Actibacterium sp. 188UL27-1]MBM7068784.1 oxygen-independent coproporphyrinogen III oxidase [Actibacterium sp. 188UL27-1]